jgi:hypothetical protein
MTQRPLLVICAILAGFGIMIVAMTSGFFMNLLGAGIMAFGGSAAYLILGQQTAPTGSIRKLKW